MKIIGNILWFIFSGLESAIIWFFVGLILCITIVGIPFGRQCFKFAHLTLWPFGRKAATHFIKHPVFNVFWLIIIGIELCLIYTLMGLIWCITILGIPFGLQCFKIAKLSLVPFGASVEKK